MTTPSAMQPTSSASSAEQAEQVANAAQHAPSETIAYELHSPTTGTVKFLKRVNKNMAEHYELQGYTVHELVRRQAAIVPQVVQAPIDGIRWDLFPAYLIDYREGEIITEESLQGMVAGMLKSDDYKRITSTQAAPIVATVPSGWKLVPTNPTEQQYKAGYKAWVTKGSTQRSVYDAMIAAAPSPTEPSAAMLDAAVAFALNVSLHSGYGWTDYMRDLWKVMMQANQREAHISHNSAHNDAAKKG